MRTETYHRFGIYDETPAGVMRHVRVYIDRATEALNKFEFADARKHLKFAEEIATALHTDLDKVSP